VRAPARKRAEGTSEVSAAVLDEAPVSVYVVDRRLRVALWNRAREFGVHGRPRRAVLGRPLSKVLPAAGYRASAALIRQVFATGRPHEETRETEGQRLFHVRRLPVHTDGRVSHVVCWSEDVTEARALEMRVIASDRLAFLGQLVAGVAHEISNPLAGIAGCVEALASLALRAPEAAVRREADEFRGLVRDEVARCERLVRSLVDSARPSPGPEADVAAAVGGVLRLLEHHPAFAHVRVAARMAEGLPPARLDADALRQVVLALAMNAARAMPQGGTLTVAARPRGGRIHLDVRDTGTGVPPPLRRQIFKPYFTTDPARGTGLGLAIARSLVRARGGDLVYVPRRRGACFRVVLRKAGRGR